jgi:hypothetical protein
LWLIWRQLRAALNKVYWATSIQAERRFEFMKAKIVTATTLALLTASSVQNAMAGDREWATAGKVLTGIAAASIITRALEPRPVYYTPPPTVIYQQPVVYTSAPAVVTSQPVYTTTTTVPVASVPTAPTIANAPTVGTQTVVVQQQPTVVYQQAPTVVYAAPPVVYAPAPVYYPPRFGFSVVIGGGHHWGGHHHHYSHHGHHGHGRRW